MEESKRNFIIDVLEEWINFVASRYGHPVYLVGSALNINFDNWDEVFALRDIDIVCILPDDEFEARFGGSWAHAQSFGPVAEKWCAEVGKISRKSCTSAKNMNVDFKVQSESWVLARNSGKPRLRIDKIDFDTPLI